MYTLLFRTTHLKSEKSSNSLHLTVHQWMVPEIPWNRIHLDHAIKFMGSNCLILIDAYSKYPCIHSTTSTY